MQEVWIAIIKVKVKVTALNSERIVQCFCKPGVALPFRDLCQPTQNIMHFASTARKMHTV